MNYSIPEISDGQLRERAAAIALLHERFKYETVDEDSFQRVNLGQWLIETPKPDDLRDTSFTWSPTWVRRAGDGEFVEVKKVRTLHTFSYRGFFKPSLAEVLAFAPDDFHSFDAVSIKGPGSADDLNREIVALRAGFHVGEATYWRKSSRV